MNNPRYGQFNELKEADNIIEEMKKSFKILVSIDKYKEENLHDTLNALEVSLRTCSMEFKSNFIKTFKNDTCITNFMDVVREIPVFSLTIQLQVLKTLLVFLSVDSERINDIVDDSILNALGYLLSQEYQNELEAHKANPKKAELSKEVLIQVN